MRATESTSPCERPLAARFGMSSALPFTPETRLAPSGDAVAGPLGDELVVLNLQDGAYYSLSPVAACAWGALDGLRSIADVALVVVEQFDTDAVTATRDLLELSAELLRAGLVTVAPQP